MILRKGIFWCQELNPNQEYKQDIFSPLDGINTIAKLSYVQKLVYSEYLLLDAMLTFKLCC